MMATTEVTASAVAITAVISSTASGTWYGPGSRSGHSVPCCPTAHHVSGAADYANPLAAAGGTTGTCTGGSTCRLMVPLPVGHAALPLALRRPFCGLFRI